MLQHDDFQPGEVLLQLHQVFRPGTAPGVDRLVVVTHHGEPAAQADQLFYQQVLAGVGVLVFIHQQVVDLVLPFFQNGRVVLEQDRGQQDQVVKIQRVVGFQRALVAQVGLGAEDIRRAGGRRQRLFRQHAVVFPARDALRDDVRLVALGAVLLDQQVADQGAGILRVENGEARFESQPLALARG